jgi:phage anti-repressor protein
LNHITRPLEVIETEIKFYTQQTATGIIEVGKRLIEAKAQLQHGEWGKWLERVEINQSTANKFMKVAVEISNSQSITNLGARKLFLLLDVPAEEREQFIQENKVDEMTTRELQEAIKATKQAETRAEIAEKETKLALDRAREAEETARKEKERADRLQSEPPNVIEKERVVEVIPEDIKLKLKRLESDITRWRGEAESYKNDSKKLDQIKESIKHLESHRDKLNEYIFHFDKLTDLKTGIETMFKHDLAVLRYSEALKVAKDNKQMAQMINEILQMVRNWLNDMEKEWNNKNYIEAVIVNE